MSGSRAPDEDLRPEEVAAETVAGEPTDGRDSPQVPLPEATPQEPAVAGEGESTAVATAATAEEPEPAA